MLLLENLQLLPVMLCIKSQPAVSARHSRCHFLMFLSWLRKLGGHLTWHIDCMREVGEVKTGLLWVVQPLECSISLAPDGVSSKEPACLCRRLLRDVGSIPGSGRSSGKGNGNPLQYSCLENPKDGGTWRAIVHGVTKSPGRLSTH